MTSIFDSPEFNARLFFPREDTSACPATARDLDVGGLHVRLHEVRPGAPVLLLFHGNGEVVADYDGMADAFGDAGANLAVMDFRGYGRSAGSPTLRAILADAHAVVAAVRPRIVMGRSLGSTCAAELYAASPAGVAGFVLESGLVDLEALLARRGLAVPTALPADDVATFGALGKLARGHLPLLVMHGARDTLIDPAEARAAYEAAGTTTKQLVYIADRGHNDLSLATAYWDALATFVRAC